MSFINDNRHAFVIQLWREPNATHETLTPWRGVIEHIPGGQRGPVFTHDDIAQFIAGYVPLPANTLFGSWRARLTRRAPGKSRDEELPPVE